MAGTRPFPPQLNAPLPCSKLRDQHGAHVTVSGGLLLLPTVTGTSEPSPNCSKMSCSALQDDHNIVLLHADIDMSAGVPVLSTQRKPSRVYGIIIIMRHRPTSRRAPCRPSKHAPLCDCNTTC